MKILACACLAISLSFSTVPTMYAAETLAAQSDEYKETLSYELTALFRAYRSSITKIPDAIHKPAEFLTAENIDKRVSVMHKHAKILYKVATKKKLNTDYSGVDGAVRKALSDAFEKVMRDYVAGKLELKWTGENDYISKWDGKLLPARWAKLASANFKELTNGTVTIHAITSNKLLLSAENAPDDWESALIDADMLHTTARKAAQPQQKIDDTGFRFVLPEYYKPGCMSCHGTGKGQEGLKIHPTDIKRKSFDFSGVISITIHN